jgi:chloramphenicol-sensitive protein RarD
MALGAGGLPWVALSLAATFALYSFIKNRVGRTVGALPGLTVETLVAAPFAVGYLTWLHSTGDSTLLGNGAGHIALLAASGVITGIPLLLFSGAARRLPLTVLGLLQYLGPSLQFLAGMLILGERLDHTRWIGFLLVWLALVVLTTDAVRQARISALARRRS